MLLSRRYTLLRDVIWLILSVSPYTNVQCAVRAKTQRLCIREVIEGVGKAKQLVLMFRRSVSVVSRAGTVQIDGLNPAPNSLRISYQSPGCIGFGLTQGICARLWAVRDTGTYCRQNKTGGTRTDCDSGGTGLIAN